jgi:hypothetical protein
VNPNAAKIKSEAGLHQRTHGAVERLPRRTKDLVNDGRSITYIALAGSATMYHRIREEFFLALLPVFTLVGSRSSTSALALEGIARVQTCRGNAVGHHSAGDAVSLLLESVAWLAGCQLFLKEKRNS